MPRTPSLRTNFLWQLLTNGLAAVAQLVITLAIANATSTVVTGEFTIAWALCTPIFLFAGFDLRSVQATDARGEFSVVDQLAIRLISGLIASIACLTYVLARGWPESLLLVVAAISVGKYCELIADTFVGLMQRHERFELVTRSTAIRALVGCLSLSVAIMLTHDLVTSVMCSAIASLAVMACVEIPWGRQFVDRVGLKVHDDSMRLDPSAHAVAGLSLWRRPIQRDGLRRLVELGLPLAVRALLVSMTPSVARFFVEVYHGFGNVGVFGVISQLTMAAILFSRSLNPAFAPRLSRYLRDGDLAGFRGLLLKVRLLYAAIGLGSLLTVVCFGRPILRLVLKPEYAAHYDVFVCAMLATAILFQGGVLDVALVTLRRVQSLALTSLITLTTMCLSGWLMVPGWGLRGAALSVALSWAVRGVHLQIELSRELRRLSAVANESATENRAAA